MLINQIPMHLRNTVEHLDLPIYMELDGPDLRLPSNLALGDTLMALGFLRNLDRKVRLHLDSAHLELLKGHPLIAELVNPPQPLRKLGLTSLPVARRGRSASFGSNTNHRLQLPVLPVDQIRANPVYSHSLYYQLPNLDDRPGLFIDDSKPFQLKSLLGRSLPNLVIYPVNPGRSSSFWQDPDWWQGLMERIAGKYHIIAVGADGYGPWAGMADVCLAKSDPASRLPDLAKLCRAAHGFVGRDGGLAHLASAAGARTITIWDSMSSYRYWASRAGNHLLMSNPYGFRYPQALRLTLQDMKQNYRHISLNGPDGAREHIELPLQGFKKKVRELFGDFNRYGAYIQQMREEEEDRQGVLGWLGHPEIKKKFYEKSLDFTLACLNGHTKPGINWAAPVLS